MTAAMIPTETLSAESRAMQRFPEGGDPRVYGDAAVVPERGRHVQARRIHSVKGQDIKPYDDPHWVGSIGMIGSTPDYKAIMSADLLSMWAGIAPTRTFYPAGRSAVRRGSTSRHRSHPCWPYRSRREQARRRGSDRPRSRALDRLTSRRGRGSDELQPRLVNRDGSRESRRHGR